MASSSCANYGPTPPGQDSSAGEGRAKKSQPRQLLSCTKCRERKVKCDRTKPCSACCARGHPRECEFVVGEGSDYGPIQQSYEIRQLRAENQRLKERLRDARLPHSDKDDDGDEPSDRRETRRGAKSTSRQRQFRTGDRVDNLYFGTPGLASIVSDFANLQVGTQSLTHTVPKGKDMYAAGFPTYPFPVVPNRITTSTLLDVLPPRDEIFEYLEMFQRRAQSCSFPHTPDEVTKKEVERFLDNAEYYGERAPDMLALIFITLSTGLQVGQYDRNGGRWDKAASEVTRGSGDVYLAASMQCLRNASFMNQPTLLGIQTLVMMGPYLTNSGRFLDAWTLFGTTIRLAHSIGLHRNPKFLDPTPLLKECTVRQTLWWWILHMDQQYSVALGRPLGISGFGDCPPPQQLTTNPTVLRLSEFIDHFTILARQILSSGEIMMVWKIDDFTDRLLTLWDTMPASLQFNESWIQEMTTLPEWPLEVQAAMLFTKVQSFLILLNRQRFEKQLSSKSHDDLPSSSARSTFQTSSPDLPGFSDPTLHSAIVRGRELVINSSTHILHVFLFFYRRLPAVLICWTMGQQAFNACMILLLDALETENEVHEWLIEQAYIVFSALHINAVHTLAELAVHRISRLMEDIKQRRQDRERTAELSKQILASQQQSQSSPVVDTTMTDRFGSTVMGNTGMFLLEDWGLQTPLPQSFQPLGWNMVDSLQSTLSDNNTPQPGTSSPALFPLDVPIAPFPVVTGPYVPSPAISATSSPYAVGLQPRMPAQTSLRHLNSRPVPAQPRLASLNGNATLNGNANAPAPQPSQGQGRGITSPPLVRRSQQGRSGHR